MIKLRITPTETIIIGGHGDKEKLEERINSISAEIENVESSYDKEKLQERLAKLTGGVAVIKVGGATEVEVKELKDRVDDAICATKAALKKVYYLVVALRSMLIIGNLMKQGYQIVCGKNL